MSPPLTGPIPHVLELGECFQRRPLRLVQATVEYLDLSPLSQGPGLTFVVALLAEGDGGRGQGGNRVVGPALALLHQPTDDLDLGSKRGLVGQDNELGGLGNVAVGALLIPQRQRQRCQFHQYQHRLRRPGHPVGADQVQRLLIVAAGRRKSHVSAGLLGRLDYPAASTGIDVGAQCVASVHRPHLSHEQSSLGIVVG